MKTLQRSAIIRRERLMITCNETSSRVDGSRPPAASPTLPLAAGYL